MSNNLLAGIAQLTVDGVTFQLAGDGKYSPSSVKRDSLTGQDSVHGFKEMPTIAFISGTIRDSGSFPVAYFNSMRNVTVVLQLANGKVIVGRSMWVVEVQEVDTVEGSFDVRFEGPQVSEQMAISL